MDPATEIADLRRRLAQAEEALRSNGGIFRKHDARESEEQLPALFDSIDEGFCIIEVTGGEHGKIVGASWPVADIADSVKGS